MYFYNLIKELSKDKETVMYVDMDGVIAAYDFGFPLNFQSKRPLITNINTLKKVNELDNVTLKILSACRTDEQIKEKNDWLDINAPFFLKENRHILSRASNNNIPSNLMKAEFLKTVNHNIQIILLDDDNSVLKEVHRQHEDIICLQDSELID